MQVKFEGQGHSSQSQENKNVAEVVDVTSSKVSVLSHCTDSNQIQSPNGPCRFFDQPNKFKQKRCHILYTGYSTSIPSKLTQKVLKLAVILLYESVTTITVISLS